MLPTPKSTLTDADFVGISSTDVFTIQDHFVLRNGKPIPYLPHDKLAGRRDIADIDWMVYHFTSGRDNLLGTCMDLKSAAKQADVHLVLSSSGKLVQMSPLNKVCWHVGAHPPYQGQSYLNNSSVGLEVMNPGPLDPLGLGKYRAWFGQIFDGPTNSIVESKHKNYGNKVFGWIPFSEAQLQITAALAALICVTYKADLVGHDDIRADKYDPGPFSHIDIMKNRLGSRRGQD
jgi:N-acetylmuramoyl-L-alanine amidase